MEFRSSSARSDAVAFGWPLYGIDVLSVPTKMFEYQSFLPSIFCCSTAYWPLELITARENRLRSDQTRGCWRGNEIASEAARLPACSAGLRDWPGVIVSDGVADPVGWVDSDAFGLGESVACVAGGGVVCACGSSPRLATRKTPPAISSTRTAAPAIMNGNGIRLDELGSGSGRRRLG